MKLKSLKTYLVVVAMYGVVKVIRRWSLQEEEWIRELWQQAEVEGAGAEKARNYTLGNVVLKKAPIKRKWMGGRGKRKISARRKNFGSLEEWREGEDMKKVSFCKHDFVIASSQPPP